MPALIDVVRASFERFPAAARSYRTLRSIWQFQRSGPRRAPYGLPLWAPPSIDIETFETTELTFLRPRLERADVFIDVGANVGFYTCLAASLGKRVVAVEPLHENLEYLYVNLMRNSLEGVEVFPVGAGKTSSLVPIFGGATGASLVPGWAGVSTAYRTTIPVTSLDMLLSARFQGERLVFKVDVEGAELDVLEGASELLARAAPSGWMIEAALTEHHPGGKNDRFAKVFERFWRLGYEARTIDAQPREVRPSDVERWCARAHQDFGSWNFWFERSR
jgi:FkbM family methyltransferase